MGAKVNITARRCKRCIKVLTAVPDGGLCAQCAQFWKVVKGAVVKK